MIKRAFITLVSLIIGVADLPGETTRGESTIYDPDPSHHWNRLNETLFSRTAPDGKKFGLDPLDILYWHWTTNLLAGPSHQHALTILDEFARTHGEQLIQDPFKRALLQRDLWELFDWSTSSFRSPGMTRTAEDLQVRVVSLIRRLALTTNEIARLPDNYAQGESLGLPDFPRDLLRTNGGWLNIGVNFARSPVAPTHVSEFKGHSSFNVLVRIPGGRPSADAYLKELPYYRSENLRLNPKIPQFPTNTEWALVRRMCVIDTEGRIQPTSITENIQVRRVLAIKNMDQLSRDAQQFFEFEMDRRRQGALRAIGKDEKGFPFVRFRSQGNDPFEDYQNSADGRQPPNSDGFQTAVLGTCFLCHNGSGIYSVLSYTGFPAPLSLPFQQPADLFPVDLEREAKAAIYWKQQQFDWGLLQGLWRHADRL